MSGPTDRALGMQRRITRRDFLNGVGVTLTGSIAYPWFAGGRVEQASAFAPERSPEYYPPARTGLRGTHDGAWEVAHALPDGKTWEAATDSGEVYDLIVVGGGISGLAATRGKAHGRGARILVLGHDVSRRPRQRVRRAANIVGTRHAGHRRAAHRVTAGLRDELGIHTEKFFTAFDAGRLVARARQGVLPTKETWTSIDSSGRRGDRRKRPPPAAGGGGGRAVPAAARNDFVRVHEERTISAGLSVQEKRARLRK
jgi:spermidine dehydrogenase